MREKQIKLIYYSLHGSEGKEFILSWKKIISTLFSIFVVLLLLSGATIGLFTDFYHNYTVKHLTQANGELQKQLSRMGTAVAQLDERMRYLEKENDDLHVFADVPQLDEDTRQVGVGGAVNGTDDAYVAMGMLPPKLNEKTTSIRSVIDQLERRVALYNDERLKIESALAKRQDQLKHRPSIRPVHGGRISDRFGVRIDPFTDVRRHHYGLDISVPHGTDVYATAAGKIVRAKKNYIRNKGFGKEVLVDHGNGLVTRFAHLSNVLVKEGQTVDRWTVIGKVGDTGRSTGPHLHYEVLENGKAINPDNFILN